MSYYEKYWADRIKKRKHREQGYEKGYNDAMKTVHITEKFDFEATNINEMADWLTKKGKDYAWTCECGSVNFALRGDHKIECNKCGKETGLVWT